MRGLIGNRLLKWFIGDFQRPLFKTAPEAASNHADAEATDPSDNSSIHTPTGHPDGTVHKTKAEAEAAHHPERG